MLKQMTKEEIRKYVFEIAELLDSKKAENIVILDFEEKNDITDYMIICSVDTLIQIRALTNIVEKKMNEHGIKTLNKTLEMEDNPWMLLDFVFVVVHIFETETRTYYNLEKLWSDAKLIEFQPTNINIKNSKKI